MATPRWSLLSTYGQALLCIYRDPTARLRDIAAELAVTERRAYTIVNDLTQAGYLVKIKAGQRNHYQVQTDRHLTDRAGHQQNLGDVLAFLAGPDPYHQRRRATD